MTPICIVGEYRGAEEDRIDRSFVGPSGVELLRELDEAGVLTLTREDRAFISKYYNLGDPRAIDSIWSLHRDEIYRTNVLEFHPPGGNLDTICGAKPDGIPGYPQIAKSKYLHKMFAPQLDRLAEELLRENPNLIITLGNTALWALSGSTGISKVRGTTYYSTHTVGEFKCLSTYNPAAIFKQYELRPTIIMDLTKAARESQFPDIRRPNFEAWIEPTLEDIGRFIETYIRGCDLLSVDIETSGTRITCLGLGPRPNLAIVIPFDDQRRPDRNYWPTAEAERQCWGLIRSVLEDAKIAKLFQNGIYDIGFLARSYGILVKGAKEDTMLLSHALQPESLKGLGYLGSIYCDFGSWKSMRTKHSTLKRDE